MRRLVIVALLTAAAGGRAEAYVQTLDNDVMPPVPIRWQQTCPTVTIYLNGFEHSPANVGMSVDAIVKSITAAAHVWSADAVNCPAGGSPFLEIVPTLAPATATPPPIANDARNTIIFRTESWSKSGQPEPEPGYVPQALAVTTWHAAPDGHIVDVDIEINAATPSLVQWMNLDPGTVGPGAGNGGDTTAPIYDLQNALTHEFGHFIGLAHTCFTPGATGQLRPTDDQGRPVPDCGAADVSTEVSDSVMYYETQNYLETSKRTLSTDDIAAVCAIYAQSSFHEACPLDQASPGCAVAPRARSSWGLGAAGAGLAAALVLVAARRRARRRPVSARARARA